MALLNDVIDALLSPSLLISCLMLYGANLAIYRVYFSPLASFPGPKLAALTSWYEFYYNVIKDGQFTFHLHKLHDVYGPIIRISPCELHVRDPDYYETIYDAHGSPRDKFTPHIRWTDTATSAQATVDHDLHKMRRAAQNPFFSRKQIQNFTPFIQYSVDRLIGRFANEFNGSENLLSLSDAYGCYSGDIMMEFCFSRNKNFLDIPDFRSPFIEAIHNLEAAVHVLINFPWLIRIVKSLPEALLPATVIIVLDYMKDMRIQIQDIMEDRNQGYKDATHPTVFKNLLDSNLPPQEKTLDRLHHEGITLVGAGQETVRTALIIASYYIIRNPLIMKKLKGELLTVFPDPADPPKLSVLERLPYFSACIQETLRFTYGTASRLVRIAHTPLKYGPYNIPARTPISQAHYCMHHDETLFPDSFSFIPERWLDSPKAPSLNTPASAATKANGEVASKLLTRYLVPFSKGPRSCVGMHLAHAQLHIVLANIFRRCELDLYETEWRDIGYVRDLFVPMPASDGNGLRVLVKGVV